MSRSEIDNKDSQSCLEINLQQLEQIISDMMSYDVSNIESTLAKFEKGIRLIGESQGTLRKAQQEIDTLINAEPAQLGLSTQEKHANITSLEKNIEDLKHIIATMENERNMESELIEFKRGIHLVWQSQAMLKNAEQRVRILTENNSDIALEKFSFDEADL